MISKTIFKFFHNLGNQEYFKNFPFFQFVIQWFNDPFAQTYRWSWRADAVIQISGKHIENSIDNKFDWKIDDEYAFVTPRLVETFKTFNEIENNRKEFLEIFDLICNWNYRNFSDSFPYRRNLSQCRFADITDSLFY